jgi:hypothetical protein
MMNKQRKNATKLAQAIASLRKSGLSVTDETKKGGSIGITGVRDQRKHKIYHNPDGLTFVTASTPSERQASRNALSTLKRILRGVNPGTERSPAANPAPSIGSIPEIHTSRPIRAMTVAEPAPVSLSDREWGAWKCRYWLDEKLREKNERFLSAVSTYVDRASKLLRKHESIGLAPMTDAIKRILLDHHYKSKVLLYNCKCFEQGIVVVDHPHVPVLWATNGHIGIILESVPSS